MNVLHHTCILVVLIFVCEGKSNNICNLKIVWCLFISGNARSLVKDFSSWEDEVSYDSSEENSEVESESLDKDRATFSKLGEKIRDFMPVDKKDEELQNNNNASTISAGSSNISKSEISTLSPPLETSVSCTDTPSIDTSTKGVDNPTEEYADGILKVVPIENVNQFNVDLNQQFTELVKFNKDLRGNFIYELAPRRVNPNQNPYLMSVFKSNKPLDKIELVLSQVRPHDDGELNNDDVINVNEYLMKTYEYQRAEDENSDESFDQISEVNESISSDDTSRSIKYNSEEDSAQIY